MKRLNLIGSLSLAITLGAMAGCTNPEVPAGHEGYIYYTPLIFGQMEFRDDLRLTHDEARRIDAAVQELMQRDAAIGVALGIVRDGEIAYLKGYGLSDAENELPLICETMFRWASVSKILTAIAALQLYEQAMLDLDEDVRQYVPELPDHGQKITARQLLCHQSGIVHYTNGRVVKTKQEYDVEHPFVKGQGGLPVAGQRCFCPNLQDRRWR